MNGITDDRTGFGTLLVAIDLTAASDRVLGRVALLPLARRARVTLLHVVPSSLSAQDQRRATRSAKATVAEEARHLAEFLREDVTIESIVTVGAPANEIAARCAKTKADLIVMGRGGGRGLRDAFLGSTAERVLRRTKTPVLVVRLPPRTTYRRPALALDMDDAAGPAVSLVLKVLPTPPPRVTVIHAFDAPYRSLIYSDLSAEDREEYLEAYRHEAVANVATLVAGALADAKAPVTYAATWRTVVQFGAPRSVIPKLVKKGEADLLVLGTRGRSGLAYAFLGTVAGDVLRAVSCDVLVVPPSARR